MHAAVDSALSGAGFRPALTTASCAFPAPWRIWRTQRGFTRATSPKPLPTEPSTAPIGSKSRTSHPLPKYFGCAIAHMDFAEVKEVGCQELDESQFRECRTIWFSEAIIA